MATVRLAYRRFLATARTVGRGRARSETAREFEARLVAELGPVSAGALKELTYLYDDVRYGAGPTDAAANLAAQDRSSTVCAALAELPVGTAAGPLRHLASTTVMPARSGGLARSGAFVSSVAAPVVRR